MDEWKNNLESSGSSPLTLGLARPNNEQWGVFDGKIAEAKIYDYALEADVIEQMAGTSSITYYDGLGRTIQNQAISSDETITGTLYDSRGLPTVSSKPISEPGTNGYLTNLFGSGFISGGALPSSSPVHDYYAPHVTYDDEDYAYTITEYENSSTNRVLNTTLPGKEHRLGSGNELGTSYALNTVVTNRTWSVGSLHKTISAVQMINNRSVTLII